MSFESNYPISIGANCSVAYHLKNFKLREYSYPFDWSTTTLNQLNRVLDNNFKDYESVKIKRLSDKHLYLDNYDDLYNDDIINDPTYILSNPYNIKFAHEVIDDSDINIKNFSDSLLRRVERFRSLKNPIFIRIETDNLSEIQMENYLILVDNLDKYFDDYKIILISKNLSPISEKIINYQLNEFSPDWTFPDLDWGNIMIDSCFNKL